MRSNPDVILDGAYELKSLMNLYQDHAFKTPKDDKEIKATKKEMKIIRQQLLRKLINMKKYIRTYEEKIAPE